MASKKITRQLSIFINGKEVKNSLGGIGREIAKVKKLLKEANDPKDIKKYKAELDKLGKAYGSVKTEVYGAKKELQATDKVLKESKTSTLSLIKAFAGGTIIASVLKSGFRAAKQFVNESILLAEEAKGVEYAFKQIENSAEILERARKSTRGLVSDLDIKKAANVFKNFKIDMEPFPELLEFVATRAAQTGENFEGMMNSLVEGLSKESKLRIDNLGISQKELNSELKKTPNFVQAVANIAKKELSGAGAILDEAANSNQKWNVALENFQLNIGKGLISKASKAFYNFGANILNSITPVKNLTEEINKEQLGLNVLVNRITAVNIKTDDRDRLIGELQKKYPFLLQNIKDETTDNDSLTIALKDVNRLYIKRIALQSQQSKINEVLAISGENQNITVREKINLDNLLGKINKNVLSSALDLTNKSTIQNINLIKESILVSDGYVNASKTRGVRTGKEADALRKINALQSHYNGNLGRGKNLTTELTKEKQLLVDMESELGVTMAEINKIFNVGFEPSNGSDKPDPTEAELKRIATLKDLYKKSQEELNDLIKKENDDRLLSQKQGIEKELLAIDQKYARLKEKFILSEEEKKALSVTELAAREDALTELDDQKAREKQDLKKQRDAEFKEELDAIKEENKILEEEAKLELEIEKATTEEERQLAVIDKAEYVANVLLEIEKKKLLKEYKLKNATAEQISALETKFALKKAAATKTFEKQREKANKEGTEREKATIKERRQAYADLFGNIAQLLGENTAAGKAAAIAQATINTYQGITEVWRAKSVLPEPFGTAAKVVSTATVLASGLKSVGVIKGTNTGFYEGGPTGNKAIYNDQYGAVTGVVHEDEWVAPKWMNESPQYAPTIQWLEKARKKEIGQFYEGGPTSESSTTETFSEIQEADPNATNYALMELIQKLSSKLDEGIKAYSVRDYEDFINRKEIDAEHEEILQNTRT